MCVGGGEACTRRHVYVCEVWGGVGGRLGWNAILDVLYRGSAPQSLMRMRMIVFSICQVEISVSATGWQAGTWVRVDRDQLGRGLGAAPSVHPRFVIDVKG